MVTTSSASLSHFSQLYDQYAAALYGIILKEVKWPPHASQVLENSFLSIHAQLRHHCTKSSSLFTWMYHIVKQEIENWYLYKNNNQPSSN